MADLKDFDKEFRTAADRIGEFLQADGPRIVGTTALNFIQDNFQLEGFQGDSGVEKWPERKVTDDRGKDKRYYKRGKRAGRLTRFGQKEKERNLLVGHDSGSNRMVSSFHVEEGQGYVEITNEKEYAPFHNEGEEELPQRQMIGPSEVMDREVERQFTKHLDKLLP